MIDQVRPAQLAAWLQDALAQDPAHPPLVLDVREPWEVQLAPASLPGHELLALPMGQVPARLAELDPARPVACLCHHGGRSMRVAAFLAQQGFARVANIDGGSDAWSTELDPQVPRY